MLSESPFTYCLKRYPLVTYFSMGQKIGQRGCASEGKIGYPSVEARYSAAFHPLLSTRKTGRIVSTVAGESTLPTKYWHKLDDGRIQCDVCPRFCKLHEGQRGFCFVRACQDEQIVLTTYGRSSGFCIDPIEKKPLNHFLPGTPVLSFGTAGCNLGCKFCQNWDIS